jgi:hypothetical protein
VAGATTHRAVRALPLPDFPTVKIVALWLGRPSPTASLALAAMKQYVSQHWPSPPPA